ncbi:MAG: hypothetical protein IJK23_03100 [Clostridia bacterium]|nr:hypothetical protein [Clostridia bacterium]
MASIIRLFSFLMALIMAFFGTGASVLGSTDKTPVEVTRRDYVFDRDKLLIGAYCMNTGVSNHMEMFEWFRDAGLEFFVQTGGGDLTDDVLSFCDENGIGIIAQGTGYNKSLTNPCVWGINYRDEPSALQFEEVAAGVAAEFERDATRLPYVNLFPMYANSEQLGETADDVFGANDLTTVDSLNSDSIRYRKHVSDYLGTFDLDILSVDIYPLHWNAETHKQEASYDKWLRNLDILSEACRENNIDYWVITQAAGLADGGMKYCDTERDQRWQNYVTLAFGPKAIIYACYYTGWWDGDSHLISDAGERTDTYYAVQQANKELAAFADVYGNYAHKGAYITNKARAAGANLQLVGVKDEDKPRIETVDPLLIGVFDEKDGDGNAYVFTNMYEEFKDKSASFKVTFEGASEITLYRMGEETVINGDTMTLLLAPGEGVFVTVR